MKSNQSVFKTPQHRMLTDDQIRELHFAALHILERTGVKVYNPEAIQLLKNAGAEIEDENKVLIPPFLVEDSLRKAPSSITIYNQDGKPSMYLEGTRVYYGTGSDIPYILDSETNQRRKVTKEDMINYAILSDYLPNIDFVMSMGLLTDVPSNVADKIHFQRMIENTNKPIIFTASDLETCKSIIEMSAVITGDERKLRTRPFMILYAEPTAPLRHTNEAVEKMLLFAEKRLPLLYAPGPLSGATTTITVAGLLAQVIAEILSGLVIAQLKSPGCPFIFGSGASAMDMNTTVGSYGAPEYHTAMAALTDVAHYYNLPSFGAAGRTDSKVIDQQAAAEATMGIILGALWGNNLLHDVGFIESGITGSFEMLVLTDEIIGWTRRYMGGVEINEETLPLDVINEVGIGGSFIDHEHTFNHFRENWYPKIFDRHRHSRWVENGSKTTLIRAKEKVYDILKNHKTKELDKEIKEKINKIVHGDKNN